MATLKEQADNNPRSALNDPLSQERAARIFRKAIDRRRRRLAAEAEEAGEQ